MVEGEDGYCWDEVVIAVLETCSNICLIYIYISLFASNLPNLTLCVTYPPRTFFVTPSNTLV